MAYIDQAIGEAEACAAVADYSAAMATIATILIPAEQLGAVYTGESFVAIARAAAGRPQEDREAVLAYLVGRGRLEVQAGPHMYHPVATESYATAVDTAYTAAMEGCDGRSRAAAIVSALRYDGGVQAPRRSPYALAAELGGVTEAIAEIGRQHTPPAPTADGFDARPAWAALAAQCANAPAHGCTLQLAAAIFDAFHAACASRRYLGPNIPAASAMLDRLAIDFAADREAGRESTVTAAACEAEDLFGAIIESGAVDMIEVYASTFGVPDEDARARAISFVEAWRDSFHGDPPEEAGQVIDILRGAPLHDVDAGVGGLRFTD